MIFYLSSPGNQMHAHLLRDVPVLISYAARKNSLNGYLESFGRLLVDSGAYSVMNSGATVDVFEYRGWAQQFEWADAWAGLDDIKGDWRQSLRNYEAFPESFPTFHEDDPYELLEELAPMAAERGGWIGLGLTPPRHRKEHWVRSSLERLSDSGLHVHGWACGLYAHIPGFDSMDSTNWWRDFMKVRDAFPWLTPAESVEIIVKRYQRVPKLPAPNSTQCGLFE